MICGSKLESDGDHDVEPYVAKTGDGDETVVLGYYGSPGVPGLRPLGDLHRPAVLAGHHRHRRPAIRSPAATSSSRMPTSSARPEWPSCNSCRSGDSTVQGVAVIERTQLQRELDVTPTRVRILLSTGAEVTAPAEAAAGFDGYIQGGTCDVADRPAARAAEEPDDHDVTPYLATADGSGEPVTVAYYGAPGAPGFGLGGGLHRPGVLARHRRHRQR